MNQQTKAKIAPKVKEILKRYGVKGTLSVSNHSTLNLKITEGRIDFIGNHNAVDSYRTGGTRPATNYLNVNPYWYQEHFTGEALQFLTEIMGAMNDGNHDNSDPMTDYFDVGWYISVEIGTWNKGYTYTKQQEAA
jgi:hypothetical protein